ncbi:putative Ricin B lectin domain-containing protein [Seiridium cardinale]|uniref:Ricin B lectin domain-containing protein n=1 Tax=Seiridium cardinale TaxID=138064 RepID=A0ABR2Y6B3_9PEZI
MGFTGAGVYEIVPYRDPSDNAKWQLALVAGSGDSAEYLIINVRTGYFLTATGDNKIASTPQISPTDKTAHWTIHSTRTNGYDVYTLLILGYHSITSKVASRGQLTVKDFSTQSGADILSATKQDADNQKCIEVQKGDSKWNEDTRDGNPPQSQWLAVCELMV